MVRSYIPIPPIKDKVTTYTIRGLDWWATKYWGEECVGYEAHTVMGWISISREQGEPWYWEFNGPDIFAEQRGDCCASLEAAKAAAEAHYRERMEQGLERVG